MSMSTGYVRRNADRFRIVVAMWVLVGFGGSLLFGAFGLMLVTGTGMFADKAVVDPGVEFGPGQEVKIRDGVRPGNFLVLARPASVDLRTIECRWKSQVYSTGKQNVGRLDIARPDGLADTLTSYGPPRRTFVPVAATLDTGWMEPSTLTCSGAGVESFALASTDGILSDRFRWGTGAVLLVLAPVMAGLGALALHFTRKWHRQGTSAAPVPVPYAPAAQPGHDPYGPPGR